MQLISQIVTIVAVLAGAASTYLVSRLHERDKFERDLQIRWDQRRLDAYIAYISAAKMTGRYATRLLTLRSKNAPDAEIDEALTLLTAGETRRSEVFEALILLANGPTIEAAHALNRAVWALERPARHGEPVTEQGIRTRTETWVAAMNNLHVAARADLRVPGLFARRDTPALLTDRLDDESPDND